MPFQKQLKATNHLGGAIRGMRKRRDLSQIELGSQLGCPANTISQYEVGGMRPSIPRLISLLREAEGEERRPILKALEEQGLPASVVSLLAVNPLAAPVVPDTPGEVML